MGGGGGGLWKTRKVVKCYKQSGMAVLGSQKRVLGARRTVEAQLQPFQRGMLAARREAIPVTF